MIEAARNEQCTALLEARAIAGECDLVVHGVLRRKNVAFLFDVASGRFIPNRTRARELSPSEIRDLGDGEVLTFTAVPVGNGRRIGLDRNLNGVLDRDEKKDD